VQDKRVVIRGINGGIEIVIDLTAGFSGAIKHLRRKLAAAPDFFRDLTVKVKAFPPLGEKERKDLDMLFSQYGITWKEDALQQIEKPAPLQPTPSGRHAAADAETHAETLVIYKTLRGGQEIVFPGTVVVVGDVNPGARIVADGDVIITGACRGIVQAGAKGNRTARITAGRLLASQLRIAEVVARSPDNASNASNFSAAKFSETARIAEGIIIIEPAIGR